MIVLSPTVWVDVFTSPRHFPAPEPGDRLHAAGVPRGDSRLAGRFPTRRPSGGSRTRSFAPIWAWGRVGLARHRPVEHDPSPRVRRGDGRRCRMSDTTRVNLHCHSNLSDGYLSRSRRRADGRRGGALRGTHGPRHRGGFGSFPRHAGALRHRLHQRSGDLGARAGPGCPSAGLRFRPSTPPSDNCWKRCTPKATPQTWSTPSKVRGPDTREGQQRGGQSPAARRASGGGRHLGVHQAGGASSWRTLHGEHRPGGHRAPGCRTQGPRLDGIEALYTPYPAISRQLLVEMARKYDLLVSAGTDYHAPRRRVSPCRHRNAHGLWKAFRKAVTAPAVGKRNSRTTGLPRLRDPEGRGATGGRSSPTSCCHRPGDLPFRDRGVRADRPGDAGYAAGSQTRVIRS